MLLIAQDQLFEIEDIYAIYSPLLSVLLSTEVPVETLIINEKKGIVIDVEASLLNEYLLFLQDKPFVMDDNVAEVFEYMGHSNQLLYPLDYWKIKLQDNWVRDNFYRLKLYEDPYYGLVEVPIVNELKYATYDYKSKEYTQISYKPPKGTVVAGGAALWMSGYSEHDDFHKNPAFDDIDVFFTSSLEKSQSILLSVLDEHLKEYLARKFVKKNTTISGISTYGPHTWTYSIGTKYPVLRYAHSQHIQFVLRIYTSPTEVVHGFDVDCVGFVYDGEKLWATRRALYAAQNKVNWFDPARVSPSYAYRLIKYRKRGFNICLPNFDPSRINQSCMNSIPAELVKLLILKAKYYVDDVDVNIAAEFGIDDEMLLIYKSLVNPYIDKLKEYLSFNEEDERNIRIFIIYMYLREDTNNIKSLEIPPINEDFLFRLTWWVRGESDDIDLNMAYRPLFPQDPASLLILAEYFNLYSVAIKVSDYGDTFKNKIREDKKGRTFMLHTWITQDPMKLVSSTIYPTPIDDLESWYQHSPLYN